MILIINVNLLGYYIFFNMMVKLWLKLMIFGIRVIEYCWGFDIVLNNNVIDYYNCIVVFLVIYFFVCRIDIIFV